MRFILVFLFTVLLVQPAFALTKDEMLDKMIMENAAMMEKALGDMNQNTLATLRQKMGPATYAKFEQQGLDKALTISQPEMQTIMGQMKTMYSEVFNDTEIATLYTCQSSPEFQPIKAKLPALMQRIQQFVMQRVEIKQAQLRPLLEKFIAENKPQ